jgi:hypothetical protein
LATDIADPVVLSTIAQTAVLTLTLVIFILSFRSQNLANREATYQKVLDDYTDAIRMLVEKPELNRFQSEVTRAALPGMSSSPRSVEELTARNYVMLLYGLFERTHLLYRKKWIDEDTWSQWSRFLDVMARHPLFEEVHRSGEGMYDKPFMDYVSDILSKPR